MANLHYCPLCGNWRRAFDEDEGACRVCLMRRFAAGCEDAIARELATAPIHVRRRFGPYVGRRGTLGARPPRPTRRQCGEDYEAALERWELRIARMEWDAARQRLHRIRVAKAEDERRRP